MSDLISRKALMRHLNDWALSESPNDPDDIRTNERYHTIQNCMEIIEKSHTAYDVDKVVERIENGIFDTEYPSERDALMEIVKSGGVDNDI